MDIQPDSVAQAVEEAEIRLVAPAGTEPGLFHLPRRRKMNLRRVRPDLDQRLAQFTGGALFDVSLTGTYYNGYDDNTVWTQAFKENANSPLYLVQNAYTVLNPDGEFPRLTLGKQGHGGDNGLASTFWLRDGKYLRLKSAQLGYSLPRKWLKHIKVENFRIFIEGSNLFTIDGLPEGIDPESPGVNNGYYPQQRTVMGGISLTF